MKNTKNRFIAGLLVASLLAGALPLQSFAAVISTDVAVAAGARDRLALTLSRSEVQRRLEAYGVDPAQVQARVSALTDEEAVQLAGHLDTLPAAGEGFIGALVFVFLLLLITDIFGLTKVFPFTRPVK